MYKYYTYHVGHAGEILPTIVVINNKIEHNKCVLLSEKPSEKRIWDRIKNEMQVDTVGIELAMAGENFMFMCVH